MTELTKMVGALTTLAVRTATNQEQLQNFIVNNGNAPRGIPKTNTSQTPNQVDMECDISDQNNIHTDQNDQK
jgi:hypothetical protein